MLTRVKTGDGKSSVIFGCFRPKKAVKSGGKLQEMVSCENSKKITDKKQNQ